MSRKYGVNKKELDRYIKLAVESLENRGFIFLSYFFDSELDNNYRNLKIVYCCKNHKEVVKCSNYTSIIGKGINYCVKCNLLKLKDTYLPKYKIKVDNVCKINNLTFINFGEYNGADTTVTVKCNECGSLATSAYEGFISRKASKFTGCRSCKIKKNHESKSEVQSEKYKLCLRNAPEGYKIVRNPTNGSMWDCWCPICSVDEFVQVGLCSGIFTQSNCSLIAGNLPCRCITGGRTTKLTQEQKEYKLRKICEDEGLTFISCSGNSVKWKCSNGHTNTTNLWRFISNGTRCKRCNIKYNKWVYFYLVRWYLPGEGTFIKLGITGKSRWRKRTYRQKQFSKLKYEILYAFKGEGSHICEIERDFKYGNIINIGIIDKSIFPDGYTETFDENYLSTVLDILKNKNVIEIFKNKENEKLLINNYRKSRKTLEDLLSKIEKFKGIDVQELTKEDLSVMYTKFLLEIT